MNQQTCVLLYESLPGTFSRSFASCLNQIQQDLREVTAHGRIVPVGEGGSCGRVYCTRALGTRQESRLYATAYLSSHLSGPPPAHREAVKRAVGLGDGKLGV